MQKMEAESFDDSCRCKGRVTSPSPQSRYDELMSHQFEPQLASDNPGGAHKRF